MWVTLSRVPTVVPESPEPSIYSLAAFIAAFSISAHILGVAKTGISPDPIAIAVFSSFTTVKEVNSIIFWLFSIADSFKWCKYKVNNYIKHKNASHPKRECKTLQKQQQQSKQQREGNKDKAALVSPPF